MGLSCLPVVLPYRMEDHPHDPLHALHVDTVATGTEGALATAKLIATTLALLHHGRPPVRILTDRVRIGQAGPPLEGPYAYLLGVGDRVPHLALPSRLDAVAGDEFGQSLAGLDPQITWGVVMDCAPLAFIGSNGLASLVEHSRRLPILLCRVPPAIAKIIEVVHLNRHLRILPDMRSAMDSLVQERASRR